MNKLLQRWRWRMHWEYTKYLLKHKFYVYVEGRRLGLGRIAMLRHDASKFRRDEWSPYAEWFYGPIGGSDDGAGNSQWRAYVESTRIKFDIAWLHHQNRNPHHWEYWVMNSYSDSNEWNTLPMPYRYVLEMVADWRGASRAKGFGRDVWYWYIHQDGMQLHPGTRREVERLIGG